MVGAAGGDSGDGTIGHDDNGGVVGVLVLETVGVDCVVGVGIYGLTGQLVVVIRRLDDGIVACNNAIGVGCRKLFIERDVGADSRIIFDRGKIDNGDGAEDLVDEGAAIDIVRET